MDWSSVFVRDALPRLVQNIERDVYRRLMPDVKDIASAAPASGQGSVPSHPQPEEPRRDDRDYDPQRVRPPPRPHPFESDPLRAAPDDGRYGRGGFGVGRTLLTHSPSACLLVTTLFAGGDLVGPGHPAYPPGRGDDWDESAGNLVGPRHPGFGPLVRDPYARSPPPPPPNRGRGDDRPPGKLFTLSLLSFLSFAEVCSHPRAFVGARFDPYGPPGVNRPGPDNDELPPPGPPSSGAYEDMFM